MLRASVQEIVGIYWWNCKINAAWNAYFVFLNVTSSSPATWMKAESYMSCGRPVHPSVLDSLMRCKAMGWDDQLGARGRKCHESKPTVM